MRRNFKPSNLLPIASFGVHFQVLRLFHMHICVQVLSLSFLLVFLSSSLSHIFALDTVIDLELPHVSFCMDSHTYGFCISVDVCHVRFVIGRSCRDYYHMHKLKLEARDPIMLRTCSLRWHTSCYPRPFFIPIRRNGCLFPICLSTGELAGPE
ncbi:uncharacterized protein HD556DRAFT_121358 [Suillus plorans]|uniref:Uncharacterized protein n=1 Tax=Suillus plorans TaxID=116603 RepID=A0A9P7DNR2_9AGAM|nr:uncharacterized protein HD556DRAFT_121358 [Suillus plorans]KAG1799325.1 hypothetical protein HD556DRAFT_121358 [Suillus plorans]